MNETPDDQSTDASDRMSDAVDSWLKRRQAFMGKDIIEEVRRVMAGH